jgi:REP element-mobilizing transposase RayT
VPRPARIHVKNGVWHVTQRATDSEVFFLAPFDYYAFLHLLELAAKRARWKLHGYCLMTNHVHLLIQTPEPTLPQGMQFLMATFVEEFNARHGRRGALVQGRYKAALVTTDAHFVECLRYFAMNPVAAGLCQRPEQWPWSSYAGQGSLAPRIDDVLRAELDAALR